MKINFIIAISFLLICTPLFAQEEKAQIARIGGPSDILYWENEKYIVNESFLIPLKGGKYRSIYDELPFTCVMIGEAYMGGNPTIEGFQPFWLLQDSVLYLREMRFIVDTAEYLPNQKQYRMMEEFTGQKFKKSAPSFAQQEPQESIAGSMKAVWVNGVFWIKKAREENEDFILWRIKPYHKVVFKSGKLVSVKTLTPPPGVYDDDEFNNKDKKTERP